jgi:Domain of unknown function (DUF4062)
MMTKRYQVFVSSTYDDLKEERNRVIQALLNINCIPCGMEYFPAADEDAWHCIERLIPECDYYVLILAGMYGSIPPGQQKSYTQLEYELALKHKIPVLGLLHKNPLRLAADRCESQSVRRRKLERFRVQVGRKLCRFWDSADQLPGELLASLTLQIDRFPRTGWVRADAIADEDAKSELINLQRRIERQTKLLQEYKEREQGDEAELASGDEEFVLMGSVRGRIYIGSGEERQSCKRTLELHATWNSVLKFIRSHVGPRWSSSDLERAIYYEIKSDFDLRQPDALYGFEILEAEVDKIVVQLSALDLIRQRGSIWELTGKGAIYVSRLLAIRKGQLHADTTRWCTIEWLSSDWETAPESADVEEW